MLDRDKMRLFPDISYYNLLYKVPFSSVVSECHSIDLALGSIKMSTFFVGKQLIRLSICLRNRSNSAAYWHIYNYELEVSR